MYSLIFQALFAATALGQPASPVERAAVCPPCNSTNPLPPTQDPFYSLPAGWQNLPKGSIIRQQNDFLGNCNLNCQLVPANATYRILYRTTNSNGDAAASTITLIQPQLQLVPNNASRLFVYQPAWDAASINCQPSYEFLRTQSDNPGEPGLEVSVELGIVSTALRKGYYAAFSDYETLNASFTSGGTSGMAVLDGVVAALASGPSTGVSTAASVALAGYSGGAIATEWALELLASYQPSLTSKIVAAIAGGLPANLNATLYDTGVNSNVGAPLIPRAAVGLGNSDAQFNASLLAALKPGTPASTFFSAKQCTVPPQHNFTDENVISTYFTNGNAFFSGAAWTRILNKDGIMGLHGKPTVPTYFWQGCVDEIAPQPPVAALVSKYCGTNNQGSTLQYTTYANDGHGQAAIDGIGAAEAFVDSRFAGIAPPTGCVIKQNCK